MQKHIAAFDPLIMAMVHARRGNTVKAAQLFAKAVTAPDAVLAIQTLEHNNQKAFAIQASARAEAAKKQAASKKETAGKKQTASKKSKKETASKVMADEFDIEGEDPIVEEEMVEGAEDDMEDDDGDDVHVDVNLDGDDEEEEDEEEGDSTFEATLASFLKKGKSGK